MPGSGVGVIGTQGSLPRFNPPPPPLTLSSPVPSSARHAIGPGGVLARGLHPLPLLEPLDF